MMDDKHSISPTNDTTRLSIICCCSAPPAACLVLYSRQRRFNWLRTHNHKLSHSSNQTPVRPPTEEPPPQPQRCNKAASAGVALSLCRSSPCAVSCPVVSCSIVVVHGPRLFADDVVGNDVDGYSRADTPKLFQTLLYSLWWRGWMAVVQAVQHII